LRAVSVGQTCDVDAKIDLDLAASEIDRRRSVLAERGFHVGPTTWRDQGQGWPPPIIEDRGAVVDPDSIGIQLRKGQQEADLILYRGGWADVEFWTGDPADDVVMRVEGDYDDPLSVEQFGGVLDRLTDRFM
jgi:hypothetical protein